MARFEDVIQWVTNGGKARRRCWAKVYEYTRTTPPIGYERYWRIWSDKNVGGVVQGWVAKSVWNLPCDSIRDGTYYASSDADRIADDWELLEK